MGTLMRYSPNPDELVKNTTVQPVCIFLLNIWHLLVSGVNTELKESHMLNKQKIKKMCCLHYFGMTHQTLAQRDLSLFSQRHW